MNIIKEVENTLYELKDVPVEETADFINEKIINFNKTKSIKYYLQSLIISLNGELKGILCNYRSLKHQEQKKQLIYFKEILRKESVIKQIYKKYKNVKNTKIIKTVEPDHDYSNLDINFDKLSLDDIIAIFKDMVDNGNYLLSHEKIKEYSDFLNNAFLQEINSKKEYGIDICIILDAIKNRISNYEIDSESRIFFKDIYKQFKNTSQIYKNGHNVDTRDKAYLEILNYYISKENYFVIQELLRRKPELCNLRYNDEHIVFYLLDLYYFNLQNHIEKKEYIDLNYLRELYLLFTHSVGFRISYDERKQIEEYINTIICYAKENIIKEKRKNHFLNDAKKMKPMHFYEKTYYNHEEISMDRLTYEKQVVINNVINSGKKKAKEGEEVLPAFVVGNTAYTLIDNEKTKELKIHVMNVGPFVQDKSVIKEYAHKFIYENEDSDKDFILKGLPYSQGEKYDVITYSLLFYPSGKIKGLNVDKNVIEINNMYKNFYLKDGQVNAFLELYYKSIYKNGGKYETDDIYKMNDHFEGLLNDLYPAFLKKYKVPFIYYGYSKPDEDSLNESKNALINHLSQMDREEALEILNIITSRIDKYHYTLYPMENATYDLKLIRHFNYLGIENLRMLNEFYFNTHLVNMQRLDQNRKICYQHLDELIREFNSYINYVDIKSEQHYKILKRQKF